MKKRVIYIFLCIIVLYIILTIAFLLPNKIVGKCFNDIDDLSYLEEYYIEDIPISKDKNIETNPKDYISKKIKYNGRKYNIRAYIFESAEQAQEYFENVTGKSSNLNSNFSFSSGMLPGMSKYISYNGNCVLFINGGSWAPLFAKDLEKIIKNL